MENFVAELQPNTIQDNLSRGWRQNLGKFAWNIVIIYIS